MNRLILPLLFISTSLFAQSKYVREMTATSSECFDFRSKRDKSVFIAQVGLMAVSGVARGVNQVISHKYNYYLDRHPRTNQNWSNPNKSYLNKYADRNPDNGPKYFGSTTFLVATTDLWHLTDMLSHVPLYVGFVIPLCLKEFRGITPTAIIFRYCVLVSVNAMAFHLIYDKIY